MWGLQFYRAVARRNEWTFWSPYAPTTPGFVSNFGELRGLVGLAPPAPFDVVPYASTRVAAGGNASNNPFLAGTRSGTTVGADVRLGLGSALSLTGTINPDFGQGEVDPAVLNLSAVESFFPEKRPFFLEGSGIFDFGTLPVNAAFGFSRVLHSRRIGRTPQLSPDAYWSDKPDQTTILGAAKVSGQLAGGWSVGLLDAVTQREDARTLSQSGVRGASAVEPSTNYFVGRVQRDFDGGHTTLGALATSTRRSLDSTFSNTLRGAAEVLGVDGTHASADRRWTIGGFMIGSRVSGSPSAIDLTQRSSVRYYDRPDAAYLHYDPSRTSLSGHDASVGVVYQGTPLFGSIQLRETSPGFEANDLGYTSRADARSLAIAIGGEHNGSGSIISSGRITGYSTTAWNFGGDLFYDEVGVTSSADLRSFWSVSAPGSVLPAILDDRLARGGPLAKIPARWRASGSVSTDFRRRLVGRLGASFETRPEGGSDRAFTPSLTIRASPALQFSIAPTLDFLHDEAQYIRTDSSRYIFATLRQQTLTVSGRMDWTLTPALSVQMFVQPFVSTGRYGEERELLAPRTFPVRTLSGGDVSSQSNFLSRALRANAVLRWEYRSGSEFYLVWQQTRDGYSTAEESTLERGFDRVLQVPGRNVLYMKVSYRLGR